MNILYILLLSASIVYGKEVLRHVQVLYRHGDRASVKVLSNKPGQINPWPFGLGQLTDVGMKQHFELGKWLRLRYKNLLSDKYDHREIRVRSTDVDRTLMSAESNLAGMYYDERTPIIPNLNWRPIPVHTVPEMHDSILSPLKCKTYDQKLTEMYHSKRYQSLFKGYEVTRDLMRKVSNNKHLGYEDAWYIFDILFCERTHGIAPPSWVTKEVYNNISQIYDSHWQMMFKGEEFARLSGGRLLDEMVTNMEEFVKDENHRSEKMNVYSGHDINLAALLSAIGIYDGGRPPYAGCLIMELLHKSHHSKDSLKNWIVKIYYKTSSTVEPTQLPEMKLKGCKSHPCNLKDFIGLVKPRLLSAKEHRTLCPTSNSGHLILAGLPIYGLIVLLVSSFISV